jgi:hypothetical protein
MVTGWGIAARRRQARIDGKAQDNIITWKVDIGSMCQVLGERGS